MERIDRWKILNAQRRAALDRMLPHLISITVSNVTEEEVYTAFDAVAKLVELNADTIRPDVWAVIFKVASDQIGRLQLRGHEWPEHEPLTTSPTTS